MPVLSSENIGSQNRPLCTVFERCPSLDCMAKNEQGACFVAIMHQATKKKCLVSGNMERFSWVGRSDNFFFQQVNTFFSVIISSSRRYLSEREESVHLQIMLAASMSNAFDYHHSQQYLLFPSETISREMAAINVYSVLLIWTPYMRRILASGVGRLRSYCSTCASLLGELAP